MSQENENPFSRKPETSTRLQGLVNKDPVIVVTQAYGPDGEDLIDYDGPRFSGEPGIRLRVRQGDIEEDIHLSPFFGDPTKIHGLPFKEGRQCELFCPRSGAPLDEIPGMRTDEGGIYYAIYLTPKLKQGELVAINDVWGNTQSRMLSEDELLSRFADADE